MSEIFDSVVDLVGNTPLVRLSRICTSEDISCEILAKMEYLNPSGSHKDRAALYAINAAVESGRLKPGGVVVEATSGNMGAGLATGCAVRGFKMVAVMPATMSVERRKVLQALGAEVVLTPVTAEKQGEVTAEDYELCTQTAKDIAESRGGIFVDQFNNSHNTRAHYEGTGKEIIRQTDGELDFFVHTVGTAGTTMGVGKALKEHNPDIKIIFAEPEGSAVIGGNPPGAHKLQGAGAGIIPPLYGEEYCDDLITIGDDEAIEMARKLGRQEGILSGFSSGANVAAAVKLARREGGSKRIVTTINDLGLKYFSTDLF